VNRNGCEFAIVCFEEMMIEDEETEIQPTIGMIEGSNTNNPRITQSRIYKKLATQEFKLRTRKKVNFRVEL